MISHIQKLNLKEADVLLCRDVETLEFLSKVNVPGIVGVIPLVFAPTGILSLKKQDLLNLLEQLEQDVEPIPEASPVAPL
jgi:hypothetical protein